MQNCIISAKMEDMNAPEDTDSLYQYAQPGENVGKEIHQALRNLDGETAYKRARLKRLPGLLSSCLVRRYLHQHPSEQVHYALKAVLTTVLDMLEKENPKYSLLLGSRFWKGNSIKEVLTKGNEFIEQYGPMSERRLFDVQKEAISLFAIVFWRLEEVCNKDFAQVVPTTRLSNAGYVAPSTERQSGTNLTDRENRILPRYNPPPPVDALTDRELQVLISYTWGYAPRSIAEIFGISEKTVRAHLQRAKDKLGTTSITHAAWLAWRYGLMEPREDDVSLMIQNYMKSLS